MSIFMASESRLMANNNNNNNNQNNNNNFDSFAEAQRRIDEWVQREAEYPMAEQYPAYSALNLSDLESDEELPPMPESVTHLRMDNTFLTRLPPLPPRLQILSIEGNTELLSLEGLPPTLRILNAKYLSSLTELPAFPEALDTLELSDTQLTRIPALPLGLPVLRCFSNKPLTELPPLPPTLEELTIEENALTSLPPLPVNLKVLVCRSNQLTTLPALPEGLETLNCEYNKLTELPSLPDSLRAIVCGNNRLTYLPNLPAGLQSFYGFGNPYIEPFRSILTRHEFNTPALVREVRRVYQDTLQNLRRRGRNIMAYKQTVGKAGLFPENINAYVGKMLTNVNKPLNAQIETLKAKMQAPFKPNRPALTNAEREARFLGRLELSGGRRKTHKKRTHRSKTIKHTTR